MTKLGKKCETLQKIGKHMREVTGPPPEDLPEKMKEILKRLEKAKTSKD